jgi:Rrf2 family protein
VRITHKVDYGVRAVVALARALEERPGVPVKRELLSTEEAIPGKFLDDILRLLRNAGVVKSHRGPEGGWTLGRPADEITVADIIRVLEGPLASVRGIRPHDLPADGVSEPFVSLWVAVRVSLRSVLEAVTIADLAGGTLPPDVAALTDLPGAWSTGGDRRELARAARPRPAGGTPVSPS